MEWLVSSLIRILGENIALNLYIGVSSFNGETLNWPPLGQDWARALGHACKSMMFPFHQQCGLPTESIGVLKEIKLGCHDDNLGEPFLFA